MLGYLVYFSLDIVFNILFWTTKKTFSGISMLYYYYNDIDINDDNNDNNKKKLDLDLLQKQISNQTKLIEELNNKLEKLD